MVAKIIPDEPNALNFKEEANLRHFSSPSTPYSSFTRAWLLKRAHAVAN
jgi:hypothetical protein